MPPFDSLLLLTVGALIGLAMLVGAATHAFALWVQYRRDELDGSRSGAGSAPAASRIEIADLKERVRKLEAIAAGVDI